MVAEAAEVLGRAVLVVALAEEVAEAPEADLAEGAVALAEADLAEGAVALAEAELAVGGSLLFLNLASNLEDLLNLTLLLCKFDLKPRVGGLNLTQGVVKI